MMKTLAAILAEKPRRCPDCGLVMCEHRAHLCDVPRLLEVLQGIDVTPAELRTLTWLAGTETCTIDNLISLFGKCRARGRRAPWIREDDDE